VLQHRKRGHCKEREKVHSGCHRHCRNIMQVLGSGRRWVLRAWFGLAHLFRCGMLGQAVSVVEGWVAEWLRCLTCVAAAAAADSGVSTAWASSTYNSGGSGKEDQVPHPGRGSRGNVRREDADCVGASECWRERVLGRACQTQRRPRTVSFHPLSALAVTWPPPKRGCWLAHCRQADAGWCTHCCWLAATIPMLPFREL
jgi:hypothetical protein